MVIDPEVKGAMQVLGMVLVSWLIVTGLVVGVLKVMQVVLS